MSETDEATEPRLSALSRLFLGGAAVTTPKVIVVALLLLFGNQLLPFAMLFDLQESEPR